MQVYKTFFKVVKKYKTGIIMYMAIIIFMQFTMTGMNDNSKQKVEMDRCPIVVKDLDHSPVSEALYGYLDSIHNLKNEELSDDQLKDLMYYQHIAAYVEIPAGFGESFEKDGSISIHTVYDEAMPRGIFVNMQIEEYLNALRGHMLLGEDVKQAADDAAASLDTSKYVSLLQTEKNPGDRPYRMFIFLPFGILSVIFSGILPVVLSFNEKEKKNRMTVSATKSTSRNLSLILGAGTLSVIVMIVLSGISSALSGTEFLFTRNWWLTILNVFTYTVTTTFLLALIASLPLGSQKANNAGSASFFTNLIGLSFAFLGGTFVDLDILGDGVAKVGQFTPNYWYSIAMKRIWLEESSITDIFSCMGIQLIFGLTCLAVGLAISRYISEKTN